MAAQNAGVELNIPGCRRVGMQPHGLKQELVAANRGKPLREDAAKGDPQFFHFHGNTQQGSSTDDPNLLPSSRQSTTHGWSLVLAPATSLDRYRTLRPSG
jgi:hypothetical protein